MKLAARLGIFAFGTLVAFYGVQIMQRGVMVYQSSRRVTNYSPATIATGILIALLAFLPPAALVNRWLIRKKTKHDHLPEHRRHHGLK